MKLRVSIGDVIREVRTKQGMSLRTLSQKTSVSLGYLSEIELGKKEVSSEVIQCIADGLEVELAEIIVEAGFRLGGYDYDKLFAEFLENNDLVRH